MNFNFSPLIFFGTIILVGCFLKLGARLLRSTVVSWKHCFTFGFFVASIKFMDHLSGNWLDTALGPWISLIFGLLVTSVAGGWFFRHRARTTSGDFLGLRGGIQLTTLGFGIGLLTSLLIAVLRTATAA